MTQPKLEVGKKYTFPNLHPGKIFQLTSEDINSYHFDNVTCDPMVGEVLGQTVHKHSVQHFDIKEHIEEPMKNTQFIVGDRVKIYDDGISAPKGESLGTVLCTPTDNLVDVEIDGEGKALVTACLLRKITEEPMKVTEEYDPETRSTQYSFSEKSMKEKESYSPGFTIGKKYNFGSHSKNDTGIYKCIYFGTGTITFDNDDNQFNVDTVKALQELREGLIIEHTEEVKLEVGKKYNLPEPADNPYTYLGNKYYLCSKSYDFAAPHLFLSAKGRIAEYTHQEVELATEHREMINVAGKYWVTYRADFKHLTDCPLDSITKLYTNERLFSSKKEALEWIEESQRDDSYESVDDIHWDVKPFELTAKELPDDQG